MNPTRESEVVDCVERTCPRCKAIVFFATTDDPGTTCTACSSRPYPARRPRVVPIPDPIAEPIADADGSAERRRLVNIVGATCVAVCVVAFALGGVVMGAVIVLCSAGVLAAATRRRPALNGADD